GFKRLGLHNSPLIQQPACHHEIGPTHRVAWLMGTVGKECSRTRMLKEQLRAGNVRFHEAKGEKHLAKTVEGDRLILHGSVVILSSGPRRAAATDKHKAPPPRCHRPSRRRSARACPRDNGG